ncbi:MAG TPA: AAA family ATPase [Candidatus Pacearchaeota archaeon]|nr:ATP-dependent zinc metalloprotease FtsH [archaeon BMS3Abin17]HDK41811.1 AAA family ATPase [Candidatus Pacearchaeota archaeon]HDZ60758.1 AAA family ATPase [Candidatus Pacearchaeota archaeon]
MKGKKEIIELKVVESLQEDIDKGIARIPSNVMNSLKLVSGDIIEIKAKNVTVVKVMRSLTRDNNERFIRLDGTIRSNISVSIGEKVIINPIKIQEAKSVTLAPTQEGIRFSNDPTEFFHTKLMHKPLAVKQRTIIDVFGSRLNYIVSKVSPKGYVIVTPSTKLIVTDDVHEGDLNATGISYEDIGGLKNEIELVREMVELPMKNPEVFQKLGVGAPKGVLLTGPPGTGKTLLAKAVATETDSSFYSIAGPEIMSKYYGESEKHIREIFEKAEKNAPSIIFIDEIDSIAPKRSEGIDQTEKRIVAQLLTLMDGLKSRGQVVVMAATNRPEDIDIALRRPGRFDRELKINPPDEVGRKEILQIHTRGMPLSKDVNFNEIAVKTMGYTGADIEILSKEAALKALKPHFSKLKNLQEKVPTEILDKIKITRNNFLDALKMVEPSAMREVLFTKPNVKWNDIGGLYEAKEKLRELVELPLIRPDLFVLAGIKPSKGVLITGPPGTGKTLLAKAVATETNANFISVKGPELISKWVGESEKHVREIFKKARQVSPSIIFFDEFDSISKLRGVSMSDTTEKVVNQLLTELDGIEELEKVIVMAATNRKDLIDPALIRPGRIDSIIELKIPDEKSREEIFKVHTRKMPLDKTIKIIDYVKKTESWTGADIEAMCRNAGINSIKRYYKSKEKEKLIIKKEDFENGFNEVSKNILSQTKEKGLNFGDTNNLMKNISKDISLKNKVPKTRSIKKVVSKKGTKKL